MLLCSRICAYFTVSVTSSISDSTAPTITLDEAWALSTCSTATMPFCFMKATSHCV